MVPLVNTQIKGGSMVVGEDTLFWLKISLVYPGLDVTSLEDERFTFVGHGIQDDRWNDYKKFKGEGVVMFLDGEPTDAEGQSKITEDGAPSEWAESLGKKRELAQSLGAQAVVVIMEDEAFDVRSSRMKKWMLPQVHVPRPRKGRRRHQPPDPFCQTISSGCMVGHLQNEVSGEPCCIRRQWQTGQGGQVGGVV